MAGLATGFWKNRNEITKNRTVLKEYVPGMDLSKRQQYIQGWQEAVNRAVL
jgi:glycerol kinase